jgi:hypothetical protein
MQFAKVILRLCTVKRMVSWLYHPQQSHTNVIFLCTIILQHFYFPSSFYSSCSSHPLCFSGDLHGITSWIYRHLFSPCFFPMYLYSHCWTLHSILQLQDLGSTLIELWNLMDTPTAEQKCFDHVTSLISVSPNTKMPQGCLARELIEKFTIDRPFYVLLLYLDCHWS